VSHILRFLRCSGRIALVLYFVIGIAWLGLRYAILPQIDQWRDAIAQQLSQALGAEVSLGSVHTEWLGLYPRLTFRTVSIVDAQRGERLNLPYLHASIAWRSLTSWRLQFSRLEIVGLDVTVRRDGAGRVSVLGQTLGQVSTPDAHTASALPSSIAWLLSQPWIDLRDVTLRWIDEARQAPPLALHRAHLRIRNHDNVHQLALALSPPTALASAMDVRIEWQDADVLAEPLALSRLQGRIYARLDALQPAAWRPWLDVPAAWQDGQVWLQTSAVLDAGNLGEVALDVRVQQGQWQWDATEQVGVRAARLHVQGPWSPMAQWITALGDASSVPQDAVLRVRLQVAGLRANLPMYFEDALQFDTLALSGQVGARNGAPHLALDAVSAVNADMEVSWQGDWRAAPDVDAGLVDWHGRFKRLQAAAIVRYLPKMVRADARAWMRVGLLDGQIRDADFFLRGDLAQFPFGDAPERGDFSLRGHLIDGVIDYAATAAGDLRWPRLDAIQGSLDMRRVTLVLQADKATMSPAQDVAPIVLSNLRAHIPNIERDAQLTVTGQARAPAASYLGLMRYSPLGERLDHVFAQASGNGEWQVPLTLVVPLLHSLDLTVDGQVRFANGTLQLMPEMPPFTDLQGMIAFTHERITAPKLSARFLGDGVSISGGIGPKQPGLQFAGRVTADALRDYVGLQGMQRLHGGAAYTARLARRASRGFELDVQSDLRGMALALPAPLEKPADQALKLQARWGDAADIEGTVARQQALDVRLGSDVQLRLLRRPGDADGPYFHAGALTIRQPMPAALPSGLQVNVHTPYHDASAWNHVVDLFSRSLSNHSTAPRKLLPDVHTLRVQADRLQLFGLDMQAATLHAQRRDTHHWQIDIQSPQTAGTLLWRTARADAEGHVQARFDRLTIGPLADDPETPAGALAADDEDVAIQETLNIPTLDVHVRAFTLYRHLLGELSVTGVKQPDAWALESLRIAGDGMTMQGRGLWHLRGAQRGLNLDALATVSDMGAYLTQLGMDGVMRQGQGSVQGKFFWRDLPWRLDLTNVQGTLQVNLEKGRFSRVSSRAARLLELLSIQSLQRLARLDWNLDALVRDGFPFDVLRGEIALQNGKLHTQDYRVIGPVGAIVIGGTVDLQAQRQMLQAAVIPNLDMSGAALAAGFVINPVVGVGAFLTQWLLKRPMENAMALEYRVEGTWDEPQIEEVVRQEPARRTPSDAASETSP